MRLQISVICFTLLAALVMKSCQEKSISDGTLTSNLKPVVERVFSRKKRWLLLPKGAHLKFTCNVSKRLLSQYPKGFNFNMEAACYYPVPSARIDLIPRRFRKPTTTTVKPLTTTPLTLIGIPGSLIKYRAKPAIKPGKIKRIDQNSTNLKWIDTLPTSNYYNSKKWSKYSSPNYYQKYQWSPQKQQKYVNPYQRHWQLKPNSNQWQSRPSARWQANRYANYTLNSQRNKKWRPSKLSQSTIPGPNYAAKTQNKWSWNPSISARRTSASSSSSSLASSYPSNNPQWSSVRPRYAREVDEYFEENLDYEPLYFEELDDFEDSPHYHVHRERRELFSHFEGFAKILGIDMKSCILRAICDCKRFLLPPGYSMLQDILRVVFTFPTVQGVEDEYSRIMQADYETCDKYLHNKCPLSILDWLMNSNKILK